MNKIRWNFIKALSTRIRIRLNKKTFSPVFKKVASTRSIFAVPFSLIVFIGYVWTAVVCVKKKLRYQMNTDTCGQGPR